MPHLFPSLKENISAATRDRSSCLKLVVPEKNSIASLESVDHVKALPCFSETDPPQLCQGLHFNYSELVPLPSSDAAPGTSIPHVGIQNIPEVEPWNIQLSLEGSVRRTYTDRGKTSFTHKNINMPSFNSQPILFDPTATERILDWSNCGYDELDHRLLGGTYYASRTVSSNSHEELVGEFWTSYSLSGKFYPHQLFSRNPSSNYTMNRELSMEMSTSASSEVLFECPRYSGQMEAVIPSPLNSLLSAYFQPVRIPNITVYAQIATILNITIAHLMSPKPASPFHSLSTPSDDPTALLARAAIPLLPPSHHLQPTLPQITIPHQAYFDLLPFPLLRIRGITMAAANVIKSAELKKDVLEDGLICWDLGWKDGTQVCDFRSWEAAPWFLRKWRMLLGGENGEIWQQSAWWWRLRGCAQ